MSNAGDTVAARMTVSGRVQGVGFRFFAVEAAKQLGITGWVKNLSDGRVEVEGCGVKASIDVMIERLRQGPPRASVSNVDVTWLPHQVRPENANDFHIVR